MLESDVKNTVESAQQPVPMPHDRQYQSVNTCCFLESAANNNKHLTVQTITAQRM